MRVASGCEWILWVSLVGVVVRRYIDFLILLIRTSLVSVLFCSSIPTFCLFLNFFSFLFQYFFIIKFYVLILCIKQFFSRSINTHMGDYGHPMATI